MQIKEQSESLDKLKLALAALAEQIEKPTSTNDPSGVKENEPSANTEDVKTVTVPSHADSTAADSTAADRQSTGNYSVERFIAQEKNEGGVRYYRGE